MSDRVQVLKRGLAKLLAKQNGYDWKTLIAYGESGRVMMERFENDAEQTISFLTSQELGWAEELKEFPDMVFYCKDCDKMVTNTRCNITGAGAVRFVPLEIK